MSSCFRILPPTPRVTVPSRQPPWTWTIVSCLVNPRLASHRPQPWCQPHLKGRIQWPWPHIKWCRVPRLWQWDEPAVQMQVGIANTLKVHRPCIKPIPVSRILMTAVSPVHQQWRFCSPRLKDHWSHPVCYWATWCHMTLLSHCELIISWWLFLSCQLFVGRSVAMAMSSPPPRRVCVRLPWTNGSLAARVAGWTATRVAGTTRVSHLVIYRLVLSAAAGHKLAVEKSSRASELDRQRQRSS